MRKLTANAERDGRWWAVTVPEVDGLFTQTRRLDQVEAMVKDAAALLTGEPEDAFEVEVRPVHLRPRGPAGGQNEGRNPI